ncbi:hypothetical protein EDC01DRAFT_746799, partial [Geopyxis carbonaria]
LWDQAFEKLDPEVYRTFLFDPEEPVLLLLGKVRNNAEECHRIYLEKQWKFKWKGKELILHDVASRIVIWIDKFKTIGDVIVSYDPTHAALPWGVFRFLLEVVVANSETMSILLVGLEKTSYLIDRCTIYEKLYIQPQNSAYESDYEGLEKGLLALYTAIFAFLNSAISFCSRNTAERHIRSALGTTDLSSHIEEIETLEVRVFQEASTLEAICELTERFARVFEFLIKVTDSTARFESKLDAIHTELQKSKRSEILKWTSNVPYEQHHQRIKETRLDGTGEWILQRNEYQEWRASSSSMLLLLHGIPGAGKTRLVSRVIDSLLECRGKGEALAYFYIDRNEGSRRRSDIILRTLVKQLSFERHNLGLLPPIIKCYGQRDEAGRLTDPLTVCESRDLIIEYSRIYPQTILIIDALDECDLGAREGLLEALKHIIVSSKSLVKILVASRADDDILLQLADFPSYRIEAKDNQTDIKNFVEDELEKCIQKKRLLKGCVHQELKSLITTTLVTGADGMFQWVALQIDYLCMLYTESDIRAKLGRLPANLTKMYQEIYQRICSQEGSGPLLASRAFSWLMCSLEPLTPEQLLIAISDGNRSKELNIDALLKICHNLIIIDHKLNVMRFAHLSVREFFDGQGSFMEVDNHIRAATSCLSLLCTDDVWLENTENTDENPLLRYASLFWVNHAVYCGNYSEKSETGRALEKFLHPQNPYRHYEKWLMYVCTTVARINYIERQKIFLVSHLEDLRRQPSNPLMAAVSFEFNQAFHKFVRFLDRDSLGVTLLVSSYRGKLDITQALIKAGVDVNFRGGKPLVDAARYGHEAIVNLLLEHGADVNTRGGAALMRAAEKGYVKIVKTLLFEKAEVNAHNGWALEKSARYGHVEVVKMLLDHGADVNVGNGDALLKSARYGHVEVVKMLLDHGADVNVGDGDALLGATENGHQDIVRILLNANMDHRKIDGLKLSMAAVGANEAIFKMLMNSGMNIFLEDGQLLLNATRKGSERIVEILLDAGADACVQGGKALAEAAHNGNERIVRMLMDEGANTDSDGSLTRALKTAIVEDHQGVAEILLDAGANPGKWNNDRKDHPINYALQHRNFHLIKLLIHAGARPVTLNLQNQLIRFVSPGNNEAMPPDILALLLDTGLQPESAWLAEAAYRGKKDLVKRRDSSHA